MLNGIKLPLIALLGIQSGLDNIFPLMEFDRNQNSLDLARHHTIRYFQAS